MVPWDMTPMALKVVGDDGTPVGSGLSEHRPIGASGSLANTAPARSYATEQRRVFP